MKVRKDTTGRPDLAVLALVVAAVVVGAVAVAVDPVVGLGAGVMVLLLVLRAYGSLVPLGGVLLLLTVNPPTVGIESDSLERALKLAVFLVVVATLAYRRPASRVWLLPLAALAVMTVTTYTLSDPLPGVNPLTSVLTILTLSLGWFACATVFTGVVQMSRLLLVIAFLPIVSVVGGMLLQTIGLIQGDAFFEAANGRLGGATHPAYLAFLGVAAVAALVALAGLRSVTKGLVALLLIDLTILVLSGGRGGALVAVMILVPRLVAVFAVRARNIGAALVARVAIVLAIVVTVVVVVPALTARETANPDSDSLSSGRFVAWEFFLGQWEENPLFGRGLGAGPLASETATGLPDEFVGQHNEYVRVLLEGGLVGLGLFVLAMGAVFAAAARRHRGLVRADVLALGIGFFVYSFTDNTMSNYIFFLPIALVLAAYLNGPRPAARRTGGPSIATSGGPDPRLPLPALAAVGTR